jgi:hypothetical protein
MDEGRSGENVVTQTDNTKCRKERKKKKQFTYLS